MPRTAFQCWESLPSSLPHVGTMMRLHFGCASPTSAAERGMCGSRLFGKLKRSLGARDDEAQDLTQGCRASFCFRQQLLLGLLPILAHICTSASQAAAACPILSSRFRSAARLTLRQRPCAVPSVRARLWCRGPKQSWERQKAKKVPARRSRKQAPFHPCRTMCGAPCSSLSKRVLE